MPSRPQQIQQNAPEAVQLPKEQTAAAPALSGVEVEERGMMRCIMKHERNSSCNVGVNWTYPQDKLDEAYEKCAYITEHYAKTFYLGTQLMTPEKARAVCAIYVWCRRTDELVDGPNADRITPEVRFNTLLCVTTLIELCRLQVVLTCCCRTCTRPRILNHSARPTVFCNHKVTYFRPLVHLP